MGYEEDYVGDEIPAKPVKDTIVQIKPILNFCEVPEIKSEVFFPGASDCTIGVFSGSGLCNINNELPSTFCTIEFYSQRKNVQARYKAQTKVINKSDHPEWNERFEFLLDSKPEYLKISCWGKSENDDGEDYLLGRTIIPGNKMKDFQYETKKKFPLQITEQDKKKKYLQAQGEVTVEINFNVDKDILANYLFDSLPEEILLQIFSWLDYASLEHVELVSKKWYRLSKDNKLLFTMGKRVHKKGDNVSARKLYILAANYGNDSSMDELGRIYQHGVGIKADPIQAFAWYHKSAQMGNGCGMNDLGWCFEKGLGCKQNEKKAAKWYLKAAIAGNVSGENNIGWCYQKGLGIDIDFTKAVKWYKSAADHGNSSGYNNLAWCFHQGLGIQQDFRKAIEIYKKAANLGNKYAQNTLGNIYLNGQGVEPNEKKAIKWYEKASQQGHAVAKERLRTIRENLKATTNQS